MGLSESKCNGCSNHCSVHAALLVNCGLHFPTLHFRINACSSELLGLIESNLQAFLGELFFPCQAISRHSFPIPHCACVQLRGLEICGQRKPGGHFNMFYGDVCQNFEYLPNQVGVLEWLQDSFFWE